MNILYPTAQHYSLIFYNLSIKYVQWISDRGKHICLYGSVNWAIIGSCNGLSLIRRQAITWTNAGLLSIGLLGTNFNIWKCIWKCHLPKWRLFCQGRDELRDPTLVIIACVLHVNHQQAQHWLESYRCFSMSRRHLNDICRFFPVQMFLHFCMVCRWYITMITNMVGESRWWQWYGFVVDGDDGDDDEDDDHPRHLIYINVGFIHNYCTLSTVVGA